MKREQLLRYLRRMGCYLSSARAPDILCGAIRKPEALKPCRVITKFPINLPRKFAAVSVSSKPMSERKNEASYRVIFQQLFYLSEDCVGDKVSKRAILNKYNARNHPVTFFVNTLIKRLKII